MQAVSTSCRTYQQHLIRYNLLAIVLKLFHLIHNFGYSWTLHVDQTKGSDVNIIIFEVFQIVRFDVECCEHVMVAKVVHLQLENLRNGRELKFKFKQSA